MNKINICGIGPGHKSYILPIVFSTVEESDIVIGGKRNLTNFDTTSKEVIEFTTNITEVVDKLRNRGDKTSTLVVSGDTGFHSMLRTMKQYFETSELNVIPGISSYQYMFAKLGMSYEDALLTSVHGEARNIIEELKKTGKLFLLTDPRNSWKFIAEELISEGFSKSIMHIGQNLSYENEILKSGKIEDIINEQIDTRLCSVIIEK